MSTDIAESENTQFRCQFEW